ncbi:MAG: hypothetical protein P1V51_16165 [Deltaproteobacteria bacterium]|nr:hypothetical protein [Deltaproteobacteria bacterium]
MPRSRLAPSSLALILLLGLGVACGEGRGGRDDGGGGGDWCEEEGRYANGTCDDACPQPDPDCDSVDPCYGPDRYGDGTCDLDCLHPDPDCNNVDPCAVEGRYGNGTCDLDCPQPDPDCNAPVDTCQSEGRYSDGPCDACAQLDSDCQALATDPCTDTDYGDGTCEACRHFDPDCSPLPLTAPTDLQATDGLYLDRVSLSWLPQPAAAGYRLYRADDELGPATLLAELPATRDILEQPGGPGGPARESHEDTSASPGVPYWYELTALDAATESAPSSRALGSRAMDDPSLLGPPVNVQAFATGPDGMTVTWDAVAGAGAYQVHVAGSAADLALPGSQIGGTSETRMGYGVYAPGATFWVGVRALADFTSPAGPMSTPVSVTLDADPTLPAPVGLQGSTTFADRIDFTWQPVTGADFYRVYHQGAGNLARTPVTGDVAGPSASYSGPLADAPAYYHVRAFTLAGESSPFSNRATGSLVPLPPPMHLTATPTGSDTVSLTWTAVPEAASYVVLRGDDPAGVVQEVGTPAAAAHEDTGLLPATPYYYAVVGVTASGRRGMTSGATLAITLPALLPPANLSASQDLLDRVSLSWDEVSGATAYRLYRDDGGWTQLGGDLLGPPYDDYPSLARLDQLLTYRITTVGPAGESAPSTTVQGAARRLTNPTGQSATTASTPTDTRPDTGIVVRWQEVSGAAGYRIYRTHDYGTPMALVGSETAPATEHWDTTVELGFLYLYKVVAVSPAGHESEILGVAYTYGFSDAAYVLANGTPMLGPSSVANTYVAATDRFEVSWTNVAGAGSYSVSRGIMDCSGTCTLVGNWLTLVAGQTATTYSDAAAPTTYPCYAFLISPTRTDGLKSIFGTRSGAACRP